MNPFLVCKCGFSWKNFEETNFILRAELKDNTLRYEWTCQKCGQPYFKKVQEPIEIQ